METKPPEQSFGELSLHYLDLLSVFLLHAVSFTDIYMLYGVVNDTPVFIMMTNWIRPIASGLMFAVMSSPVYQTKKIGTGIFLRFCVGC